MMKLLRSAALLSLAVPHTVGQLTDDYSTLSSLIEQAELSLPESGTVFAPNNEAFEYLKTMEPGNFEFLTDPANKDTLAEVIRYHVVPDEYLNSTLIMTADYPTLDDGEELRIAVTDSGVDINEGLATVVDPDIILGETLVAHGIDRVLTTAVQINTRVPTPTAPTAPSPSSPTPDSASSVVPTVAAIAGAVAAVVVAM